MRRKQFTFYSSFWETIENLPTNKEKLQAYQMICAYALTGQKPDLDAIKPSVATIFWIAKPIMDTARKRAKAGQAGTSALEANTHDLPKQV